MFSSIWAWLKSLFVSEKPVVVVKPPAPAPVPSIPVKKGDPEWYQVAWETLRYDPGCELKIRSQARLVLSGKPRYETVARSTGVPWFIIGGIHSLESGCDFRGVLHNGERIVGIGRKTQLVPKGRGPFASWELAAIDALKYDGLTKVDFDGCNMGFILKKVEAYNGLGYFKHHPRENTPYLWAMTSLNDGTGKYVADGKWSETAKSELQVGFAAIMKELVYLKELVM